MRIKLIASFLLIVLTAIGIFIVVSLRQTAQEVSNFIARRGLTGSEIVVTELEEYYKDHGSWAGVEELLRSSPRIPNPGMWGSPMRRNLTQDQELTMFHLRLVDLDRIIIADTRRAGIAEDQRITPIELNRAVPLDVDGETVGYLLAEGGQGFSPENEVSLLSRLNRAAIIAVVFAGLVAIILALILSYSLVRPVKALTEAASRLATGDLSQRVNIQGGDELATLGKTFNKMAASLQIAEESRKAMTADIAHELRTPLAVQRAHLEAIEDNVYPLTLASLSTIEEQNKLLTRLVEDLGTLALADSGQLQLQTASTDFSELILRVTAPYKQQAAERAIDINFTLEECPPLLLDSQRIQQILHNLLSNALRYTPDGGRIRCLLTVQSNTQAGNITSSDLEKSSGKETRVVFKVQDTGPGIPDEALTRIFDRFYRADKSRARAAGGTGLGLSIARKIAQAHGGDLTGANLPDGGAEFILTLPITTEKPAPEQPSV
jgi:two-component system OmpR family sensor kinase/two-component system sensor histidine kinase BaeS